MRLSMLRIASHVEARMSASSIAPSKRRSSTLKPGGYYITSGIVDGREQEVSCAMEKAGLTDITVTNQGEWHCVTGRKPAAEI